MNYKRAMAADPSISYTAKSGWKMRQIIARSILDAIQKTFAEWNEFEHLARSLRSERLIGRLPSTPMDEMTDLSQEAGDMCEYVSENYPDGSLLPFNTAFTKTWVLRNNGSVPWIDRWQRRHTPLSPMFPRTPDAVRVPNTLPGETANISVDVLTTRVSGFSEVRFKMVDRNGELCWPTFYPYGSGFVIETRNFDPALTRLGMDRVPWRL